MNIAQFETELAEFNRRFAAAKPELSLSITDPEYGLEGYICVWNSQPGARGPLGPCGKGGTRITPSLTLGEVEMLAQRMALKNAASGLPLGGAKSGLRADPDSPGFEKVYRRFALLVSPYLKENGGIFGGFGFDIGARPAHPSWICDELKSTRSFTGKPLEMGGTDYDREGIAGFGVAVAARTALEAVGIPVEGASCAIQGLGAMGAAVTRYMRSFGARIKAIADPRVGGTILLPELLPDDLVQAFVDQDVAKIKLWLAEKKLTTLPLNSIHAQEVSVFLPCARQDVIDLKNCAEIKAKLVVEGANNPCSKEAQLALHRRGVIVIPDFIANPGGIIAAFVELTSKVSAEENVKSRLKVKEALALTEEKISRNVESMLKISADTGASAVDAGLLLAFRNMYN